MQTKAKDTQKKTPGPYIYLVTALNCIKVATVL